MVLRRSTSKRTPLYGVPLRRAIVALCVFAFLMVGFAHSVHHLETTPPAASWQLDVDKSGSPAEPAKKAFVVEHCLGCTIIAVVPGSDCDLVLRCGSKAGQRDFDGLRSHATSIEPPPPKMSA